MPKRFIPAWAGNSRKAPPNPRGFSVHPRVGGEQTATHVRIPDCTGSSPRGRGTGGLRRDGFVTRRFIPAWAGNRVLSGFQCQRIAVHPRVGGEQVGASATATCAAGSSPRGRGTGTARCRPEPLWRFIPAWAGNSSRHCATWRIPPVHPRVGGEQVDIGREVQKQAGSSPRGRGTVGWPPFTKSRTRFIPAWAGNRSQVEKCCSVPPVHPRVGGEQAALATAIDALGGSSPRGRGTVCLHLGFR